MTPREARAWLIASLEGISSEPEAEARWMLDAVKKASTDITQGALAALESYVEQRKTGRPLQYILGEWDFYGLTLHVREGALIPRPETETLVELALCRADAVGLSTALEIGAGSGCVAVALAKFGRFACVTATDVSAHALALARENAALNGVCAEFLQGEWYAPVAGRKFGIIVSNPPYIPTAELSTLLRELFFEPALALDGGPDGLAAYRALASGLAAHLDANGFAFFEVGHDQAPSVRALFEARGFATRAHLDLYRVERFVEAWFV